jgi:flavodoxin
MRKITFIALLFVLILSISLTACGSTQQTGNINVQPAVHQSGEEGSEADSDTHVLVIYFAYSENMGNTDGMSVDAITSASLNRHTDNIEGNLQIMAQEAALVKNGDIFSVKITEPYDPDYETMVRPAQADQRNGKEFSFVDAIENLDAYDTVYIGIPVWWNKLPQPMVSFFEAYDFSGKVIIPFGIHLGSRFGTMIDQIKSLEPGANVRDGFTISADTDNEKVRSEFNAFLNSID